MLPLYAPSATLPKRQTPGSFGYDVAITEDVTLIPGEAVLAPTGLRLGSEGLPVFDGPTPGELYKGDDLAGVAMLLLPRSSLFAKYGAVIPNAPGLVDADYDGEIKVQLVNVTGTPTVVAAGTRVAQLLFVKVWLPEIISDVSPLQSGRGGFGSTGS